ncbi:MAG: hypothetical protein IBX39_01550 [Candidatus Methanoperedenaceae archaeon]|nr:hypothetical protein [Candidatus Methanoperedenaceae archaeon]
MTPQPRTAPKYDMLFSSGTFNATLLIGPDPMGANYDYSVFFGARLKLRNIGLKLTGSRGGFEVYEALFDYNNTTVRACIRLVHGRNFYGDLMELWGETLANEDMVYLKTHAGYGKHLSLGEDVNFFTDAMKEGLDSHDRKPYQLYYLDCCKSEMYYRNAFRDYVGNGVDLILHKWFCNYMIIGPVAVLIRELMRGSGFPTIIDEMNEEYGTVHVDVEDTPEDLMQDRKMVTYSVSGE